MNEDIKTLIDLLDAEGRDDLSEILGDATSELNVSNQYGSRLFSLISSFIIYLPPIDFVKSKKFTDSDQTLILEMVRGIYPVRDHEPEVVSVEFSVKKNYSSPAKPASDASKKNPLYSIKSLIGQGGFGEVHEAIGKDGTAFAIKFIKKDHEAEDLKRFKREVNIQSELKHENIVPILDMNLATTLPWFVMPKAYFNLEDYLKKHSGEKEIPIFIQIAKGVAFAHSKGVIHRDLKPSNVLMFPMAENKGLRPAISDFGLGKFINHDSPAVTFSNFPIGTVEYVAPEQWKNAKNAKEPADIYSLGKLLYEILSGKNPYPSLDYESIPKKYFYIIDKATKEDPQKRYKNVEEFIADVDLTYQRPLELEKSSETILKNLKDLKSKGRVSPKVIEDLAKSLLTITANSDAMIDVIPEIPDLILKDLIEEQTPAFKEILKSYDSFIDEVGFDYCDVIADLYKNIFNWTKDRDIQYLILERLPQLGVSHNRWYVGRAFADLVRNLTEESLVLFTRDVLKGNPRAAEWCETYLLEVNLPRIIRNLYPQK